MSKDFAKVNVETGEVVKSNGASITHADDFPSGGLMLGNQNNGMMNASVQIESNRVLAEVMARIQLAQMMRRDQQNAVTAITRECNRYEFAKKALFAFPRGNATVSGPTIRLAEAIARYWGNIDYGYREIGQITGQSEIEAYAHDLETNTRISRTIVIKHIRDKKAGNETLTAHRDIYEHIASQAQRRVRAVILELIPADVVDRAVAHCRKAIAQGDGKKTIEERVQDMLIAFQDFGVTKIMIEDNLGHFVDSILPEELVKLQTMYTSIRDGSAKRETFFDLAAKPLQDENVTKEKTKAKKEETTQPEPELQPDQEEKVKLPKNILPENWPKGEKALRTFIEKQKYNIDKLYDEMTMAAFRDYWGKISKDKPYPLDEPKPEQQREDTVSPEPGADNGGEDEGEVTSLMDMIPD